MSGSLLVGAAQGIRYAGLVTDLSVLARKQLLVSVFVHISPA
jgi:hypothetical protein